MSPRPDISRDMTLCWAGVGNICRQHCQSLGCGGREASRSHAADSWIIIRFSIISSTSAVRLFLVQLKYKYTYAPCGFTPIQLGSGVQSEGKMEEVLNTGQGGWYLSPASTFSPRSVVTVVKLMIASGPDYEFLVHSQPRETERSTAATQCFGYASDFFIYVLSITAVNFHEPITRR